MTHSNKEQIRNIINVLSSNVDAIPAILDILTSKDAYSTIGPTANSLWQIGSNLGSVTYSAVQLWRNLGSDPIKTLLEEGLLEELAELDLLTLEVMIDKISNHPIVGPYKDLIKDLNDKEVIKALLSNKEAILETYDNLIQYQKASEGQDKLREAFLNNDKDYQEKKAKYENFLKAQGAENKKIKEVMTNNFNKALQDANDRFNASVPNSSDNSNAKYIKFANSLVAIVANKKTAKPLAKLFSSKLMEHIHELDDLKGFKNSKRIFANLAKQEKFQETVESILIQDPQNLEKVTKALLEYTSLPSNSNNDKVLARDATTKWKKMLNSVVELAAGNDEVRDNLKELLSVQLIEDIFKLDDLTQGPLLNELNKKIAQARRGESKEDIVVIEKQMLTLLEGQKTMKKYEELVKNLASQNPESFKALAGEILASKEVMNVSDKLLTYISSSVEEINENPAIWNDFLASILKLTTDPKVTEKLAPLLKGRLFDNIAQLTELKSMNLSKISICGERIFNAFAEKEESLSVLLEIVKENINPSKNTSIIEDAVINNAPELREIIDAAQKQQEISPTRAEIAKIGIDSIAKKNNQVAETKKIDYSKLAPVFRRLAQDEEFQHAIKDEKMKEFLNQMLQGNEEARKWGVNSKELAVLIKKISSKDGLNEIANYLEGKSSILKILNKTQTRSFIVKHLAIRGANWILEMPTKTTTAFKTLVTPAVSKEQTVEKQK